MAFTKVHGERLGFCWASCSLSFRTCLCVLVAGERAAALESLPPLWEAGEGGQGFQEAFLQGGSEESLGPPHAALPGPLLQCSPSKTHPRPCPKAWALTVPKRKMLSRHAGLATCGFLRLTQSPREPCSHMPGWGKGPFKATHKLAYRGVSSLWELGFLIVQSPPASIFQPSPFLPVSLFDIMTHSCLKLTLNLSLPAPYGAGLYARGGGCEGQQRGTWLCHAVSSPGPSPNSSTG